MSEPRSADLPNLDGHATGQIRYPRQTQSSFSHESERMEQTSGQSLGDPLASLWDVFAISARHHQDQEG